MLLNLFSNALKFSPVQNNNHYNQMRQAIRLSDKQTHAKDAGKKPEKLADHKEKI